MQRANGRLFIAAAICVVIVLSGSPLNSVNADSSTTDNQLIAQSGAYATANGAVNVRRGPGTGFSVMAYLHAGEVVPILGISTDGGWWYIKSSNGEGWVAASTVTASNTDNVPVQTSGPTATATGAVNVRSGAGLNAPVLGQLRKGEQVTVLGRNADGSWLEIRWAWGTGWVSASYISTAGGAVDAVSSELPVTALAPFGIVVGNVNVRTGPGINYAILGQVAGGEVLPIIGRSDDTTWYQVESPFGTGWVSAAYMIPRNEYGGAPVTTDTIDNAAIAGPIGIVNAGALNLRSGPGAQYISLGTVAGGTQGRIIGRTNDWSWWLLETETVTGWVNAMYIIVRGDTGGVPYVAPGSAVEVPPGGPSQTDDGVVAAPQPVETGPAAFVASGALNIRSGPNASFDSIGAVYGGTRMPIVGQSPDRGWWLVTSPYGNGWISKAYVLPEGDTTNVPVIQ